MGISIQEFLAGREPCEVCDSTGNQHHCITELLSRQDSCILFNAMGLNQTEQILNDTALLQELRSVIDPNINSRSNSVDIWNHIYNQYLTSVITRLRSRDRQGTFDLIMQVVTELERSYGVKH